MKNLSPGKNPPEEINVLIEIPQGGLVKYEMDKSERYIFVVLFSLLLKLRFFPASL